MMNDHSWLVPSQELHPLVDLPVFYRTSDHLCRYQCQKMPEYPHPHPGFIEMYSDIK